MLQAARANFKGGPRSTTHLSFIQGNAANLGTLEDDAESVDLTISGATLLHYISDSFRRTALRVPKAQTSH